MKVAREKIFSVKNVARHKEVALCGLKIKFKTQKSIIAYYEKNIQELTQVIHDQQATIEQKLNEIKKQQELLQQKDAKIQENSANIEYMNGKISSCEKKLQEFTQAIQNQQATLEQKELQIKKNIDDINRLNGQLDGAQEKAKEYNLRILNHKNFINDFINLIDLTTKDTDVHKYSNDIITDANTDFYDEEFYKVNAKESYDSAMKIIEVIKKFYMPKSVFDLGCGVGTWLKAWQDNGTEEILGVDANEMDEKYLYIPRKHLQIVDFEKQKIILEKKFDLAMSLECLEHISNEREDIAIQTLTNAADFILFSAAIPYQVGTNHINCHKLTYWVDKFKQEGFACFDIVRPELLKNAVKVGPWYMQNILVFARNDKQKMLEKQGMEPVNSPEMFYHSEILKDILTVNNLQGV